MNVWDNLHNIPPLTFKIWMDNQIYLGKNEWMFGPRQRVDTIKREMFSQKSVRRFVGDSSAFVMGAMFLASALNRGIHPPGNIKKCLLIPGGNASV